MHVRDDHDRRRPRGARRRVGRPRARDAPAEPVPAPRLARRVVAPVRRRAAGSRSPSRAATDGSSALPRSSSGACAASAWRASSAAHESALADLLLAESEARVDRRAGCSTSCAGSRSTTPTCSGCPARLGIRPARGGPLPLIERVEAPVLLHARRLGRRLRGEDRAPRSATSTAAGCGSSARSARSSSSSAARATSSSRCSRSASACTSCAGAGRPDGSTFGTEDGPGVPPRRAARGSPTTTSCGIVHDARRRPAGGLPLLLRARRDDVRAPPRLRPGPRALLARARRDARDARASRPTTA